MDRIVTGLGDYGTLLTSPHQLMEATGQSGLPRARHVTPDTLRLPAGLVEELRKLPDHSDGYIDDDDHIWFCGTPYALRPAPAE